jgi:hypothetical protein
VSPALAVNVTNLGWKWAITPQISARHHRESLFDHPTIVIRKMEILR